MIIVYKSAGEYIIELQIDTTSIKSNLDKKIIDKNYAKYRCDEALVVKIYNKYTNDEIDIITSDFDDKFTYYI